jgi:hypothetical protein
VVNYYIQALGVVITYETCKSSLESSENKPDNLEKPDVTVTISNVDINENVQTNLPILGSCYETCKSSLESSENKPDNQEKPDVIVTISNGDINENVQKPTQEQCRF